MVTAMRALEPATPATPDGVTRLSVDTCIAAWLHEKAQTSGSDRTVVAYRETLASYRWALARGDQDVDSADERGLALAAQAWAARPKVTTDRLGRTRRYTSGASISPATQTQRLAVVSSFYAFARRYGLTTRDGRGLVGSPIALVKRPRVQAYAAARPLPFAEVAARLAQLNHSPRTPRGQRDYALLMVALTTGRRVTELAALTWADVIIAGGAVTLEWRRCKGGQAMRDTLAPDVATALLAWLRAAYGADLAAAPSAPVWLAFPRHGQTPIQPWRGVSGQSIADVWAKWLGTTKVHATRHTFAVAMEQAGAPLTEIQRRLGHANAATTGRYLDRLTGDRNAYAPQVAALFMVAPVEPAPPDNDMSGHTPGQEIDDA